MPRRALWANGLVVVYVRTKKTNTHNLKCSELVQRLWSYSVRNTGRKTGRRAEGGHLMAPLTLLQKWWRHFPSYWTCVRGIHRSPVNSPYKSQWLGTLMCSLIGTWSNGWVNNRDASVIRRHRVYYDVTVMGKPETWITLDILASEKTIETHINL